MNTNTSIKPHTFENGMTVKELKNLIATWPEVNEDTGEDCEVWLENVDGCSNIITEVWPLNMRELDDGTMVADILLK